jgi:hypothetical protein
MMHRHLAVFVLIYALGCTTARAQQRQQPPSPRAVSPANAIAKAPAPVMPAPNAGDVEGFVYWDATTITHKPAGTCTGLAVSVSAAGSPYNTIAIGNHFKYAGQVKGFLVGGKIAVYDVCIYAYDHQPVGPQLQAQLVITDRNAFSSAVAAQNPIVTPITIINAQCNMLPPIVPSSVGDLTAHWGSCQNRAYDVNFALVPKLQVVGSSGASGGMLSSVNSGAVNPGPTQSPSRGMLAGARDPGPVQSSSGGIAGGGHSGPGNGADDLNPQPFPPKAISSTVAGQPTLTNRRAIALSAPRQSQKITNPRASSQDAAIIAVLKKQRQAADAEAAQMKLSVRPVPTLAPSRTMSAGTNSNTLLSSATAPVSVAGNPTPSPSSTPATNKYGALPEGVRPGLALQCGHDPSFRILTVSGGAGPATFTQDVKYNFYTITGCSFGDPGPNSKAYIYYQDAFHQDFQIEEWSENWIKLHLDPKLSGVDDQDQLTLVLQRADGKQTSKSGYKFYAARDTILLKQIPKRYFSLNRFRPDQSTIQSWKTTYTSGSSANVTPNLPGLSAEVHWDLTRDASGAVVGGDDIYDFSQLHSTFALSSTSMEWRDISCTEPDYSQFTTSKNNWNIDWYQAAGIQVNWQAQTCESAFHRCGGGAPFHGDCFEQFPESNYGIDVWVTGPRGLDPWTGGPSS